VFLLLITGCQSTGEKFGAAVGAAGGTTLSIIFGDSTAAEVGFRFGGQIGKNIGSAVGKYQDEYSVENPDIVSSSNWLVLVHMDSDDRAAMNQAMEKALQENATSPVSWYKSIYSKVSGRAFVARKQIIDGVECRTVQAFAYYGDNAHSEYTRFCQTEAGGWEKN